jgi:hypothetical protein
MHIAHAKVKEKKKYQDFLNFNFWRKKKYLKKIPIINLNKEIKYVLNTVKYTLHINLIQFNPFRNINLYFYESYIKTRATQSVEYPLA